MCRIERNDASDSVGWNAAGIEAIKKIRKVVNERPCLAGFGPAPVESASTSAIGYQERRNNVRQLYQELSKYYPLEGKRRVWTRPELLAKRKDRRF